MKKKSQLGFTLIEILIASLIFLTVILIGTSIFGAAVGNRAKANIVRATQQGARYAVEAISREVRMANVTEQYQNRLYYGFAILKTTGGSGPVQTSTGSDKLYKGIALAVSYLDTDNTRTERLFYVGDANNDGCDELLVQNWKTTDWDRNKLTTGARTIDPMSASRITSEDVCVTDLRFEGHHIIQVPGSYTAGSPPSYNNGGAVPARQPFVRVYLTVQSHWQGTGRAPEQEELTIDTTVASRYYNITGGQFPPAND
jgi:prepilin-type N-terminal cleavage/methylation domain-containing protein